MVDTPVGERGCTTVEFPPFDARLWLAMDYADLSAADLWRRLNAEGVKASRDTIYKLMHGQRDLPNYQLVGGLAFVCGVDVRWFYDATVPDNRNDLAQRYALRSPGMDPPKAN